MDIFMHLEKENGSLFSHSSKHNQGSFARPSKGLNMKSNGLTTSNVQPARKVLGNVNQLVQGSFSTKAKQSNKVHLKIKETYPDIETFIPYNPLDFETFDVPEEHRLSDRCLAGVSLYVSLVDAHRFEALTRADLSLMENDELDYDAYETFTPTFEDLTIELPLACDF